MSKVRKKIGSNIRTFRKARKFTQEELGAKAGISYKFLGEIERGEVNPSLHSILSIADALNINAKNLLPDDSSQISATFTPDEVKQIRKALNILDSVFSRL